MASQHFSCLACRKRFSSYIPYDLHLLTLKHKKRTAALALLDILEVRDEPGLPSDTKRGAALLSAALATKKDTNYFCDTCDVYVGHHDVEAHNKGLRHAKKARYKALLRLAVANGWACECCGIDAFYDPAAKRKHFDTTSHHEKARQVAQREAEGFKVKSASKEPLRGRAR